MAWRKVQVQRLLLIENGALLIAGLALGIIAAAVAVLPALLSANSGLSWAESAGIAGMVALSETGVAAVAAVGTVAQPIKLVAMATARARASGRVMGESQRNKEAKRSRTRRA